MKFSVVVPIFNREKYLNRCIDSILIQPEVDEILLIDDGSSDGSLEICKKYASIHNTIRVLTHENNINKGIAATRNLGILEAKNTFIAFLDSDDYYLENRFKETSEVLSIYKNIDGVYEAIDSEIDTNISKIDGLKNDLFTVNESIEPENLFFEMSPIGNKGRFSGNGLVVKKELLIKCGLFNTDFNIGEDVLLWLKIAYLGKLRAGQIHKAVAIYQRHETNITRGENTQIHLYHILNALLIWGNSQFNSSIKNIIVERMMFIIENNSKSKWSVFKQLVILSLKHPTFVSSKFFINHLKFILK